MKDDLKNTGWEQMQVLLDREMPVVQDRKKGAPFFFKLAAAMILPLIAAGGLYIGLSTSETTETPQAFHLPEQQETTQQASDDEYLDSRDETADEYDMQTVRSTSEYQPISDQQAGETTTEGDDQSGQEVPKPAEFAVEEKPGSKLEKIDKNPVASKTLARNMEAINSSEFLAGIENFSIAAETGLAGAERLPRLKTGVFKPEDDKLKISTHKMFQQPLKKTYSPGESSVDCPNRFSLGLNYIKPFFTYTHGSELAFNWNIGQGESGLSLGAGLSAQNAFRDFDQRSYELSVIELNEDPNFSEMENFYRVVEERETRNALKSYCELRLSAQYEFKTGNRWRIGVGINAHRILWTGTQNAALNSWDGMGGTLGSNAPTRLSANLKENLNTWRASSTLSVRYQIDCRYSATAAFTQNLTPFYKSDELTSFSSSNQLSVGMIYGFGK